MNGRERQFFEISDWSDGERPNDWQLTIPEPPDLDMPDGDPFMILFHGLTKAQAEHFCNRANNALEYWLEHRQADDTD